jgi:hypothetical protein
VADGVDDVMLGDRWQRPGTRSSAAWPAILEESWCYRSRLAPHNHHSN